jgi:mRNA interferase MazF
LATAGEVVVVDFVGVHGVKRRPAVIVSSKIYHQSRPDFIVGILTGQTGKASGPTDYLLQDWQAAGLVKPSAFRAFLYTAPKPSIIATVGHVTNQDWLEIAKCVRSAIAC